MTRSTPQVSRRRGTQVALLLGIGLLAGCGIASSDDAGSAEKKTTAEATEDAVFDLTDVSLDVRRDPG